MEYSLIIPIYNDEESLKLIINELQKNQSNFQNIEFIFVDNGSMTPIAKEIYGEINKIKYKNLRSEKNLGFGGGIKFGIENSEAKWVGWMPGNFKVNPNEVLKYIELMKLDDYEFLKGRRMGRSIQAQIKTFFAGLVHSFFARVNMFDSGGTPTFIKRDKYWKIAELAPNNYTFEAYMLYMTNKMKLCTKRVNTIYRQRITGTSHWQKSILSEIELLIQIIMLIRILRKQKRVN
jgi:glycosyltransferase involved in cell wall biosynthesis